MTKKRVFKGLYFSPRQVSLCEIKAAELGMNISEWIKYIISKEIEELSQYNTEDVQEYASSQMQENDNNLLEESRIDVDDTPIDPNDLPY